MTVVSPTPRADEPVTLDYLKQHLHVDFDDDDVLLTTIMVAARQKVEAFCGMLPVAEEDVPDGLREAICLFAGHLYENREAVLIGSSLSVTELPLGFMDLIAPYRDWVF